MKHISPKSLICVIACAVLFSSCFKQSLYIAKDYQKDYKYADAITYYKKSLDKNPSSEGVKGLAECYRVLRNYPMAELWYGKAYAMNNRDGEVAYQYAMMLKANGKYEEAKQFFGYFKNLQPQDSSFANEQIAGCEQAMQWQESPKDYDMVNRDDVNSRYSEFGMQQIEMEGEETFVFSSNRPGRNAEAGVAKENKAPYYELLGARMNDQERIDQIFQYRLGKNFPYHVATPTFTADYDTVYYTQTPVSKAEKESLNRLEIYYSVYNDSVWSDPMPFPYNNRAFSTGHPYLSEDGNTLYFISDIPGGQGGFDIYRTKKLDGLWQRPENLGTTINTRENEFYPIYNEGLLFFSSMGHVGMGGLDVFMARETGNSFATPENLEVPFNSAQDDFALFELPGTDGKQGFISSNRTGGSGGDDIYSFHYIEPLPPVYMLSFKPVDTEGNSVMKARFSDFAVYQTNNPGMLANEYTDVFGDVYYLLETGVDYSVKVSVPGYFEETMDIAWDEVIVKDTVIIKEDLPKQFGYVSELGIMIREIKAGKEYTINNIYFNFNSAKIRESAKLELIQLANLLLANPEVAVEIGSHCDSRGSDAYNLMLSEKRAKSVMEFLVEKGVEKARLSYQGYGETEILNECVNGVQCSDAKHEENRRTTFKITDNRFGMR